MSIKKIVDGDTRSFHQNENFLERPRLNTLLKEAIDYPLIIVCAGSGYGKTRAVHSFLENYDAHTSWLQFSERDNITTRFWESLTRMTSSLSPEAGTRLIGLGFPDTDKAFARYNIIRHEIAALPGRHIRVFDDFHLLHNPSVLRFFERMVSTPPPNMTIILISRAMPALNLVNMMMRRRVFTMQEDMLRFTEDEIAKYFNQLNLSIPGEGIRNIYDDTEGWAFAINLIARSFAKKQKYERHALEAMKKNIFRLIDAEIPQSVSKPLWRFLLRISLIDHLAASLIKVLAKDDALIKEMESLNAYIRYDYNMDMYMIHHLFRDYLRQKQDQFLTDEERRETYQTSGEWCEANGYHMDAFSYYEKSENYDAIIRKVASLNVQIPSDMAQWALEIFDRMPDEVKSQNPLFPSMYIKLKISLGQFDEASVVAGQYVKNYEGQPESPERNRALASIFAAWAVLRLKMCTYTDVYDFDVYYKKMCEYFDKSPFKIIGPYKAMSTTAWASHVGTDRPGAMEEYISALSRATPYVSRTFFGLYTGFEELVRGELCFYRGEFNNAEQYFKQSIDKARILDQYVTQNRVLVYQMRIAFYRGNLASATRKLNDMEAMLSEKDYGVRYTMYDIACGFYHLALEQPEQIPEWLKSDFSPYTHPSFLENYANQIRARYHYQTRQYSALLAFIKSTMEQHTILFGKLELKTLEALSLYQLKRRSEAIAVLAEANHLAESNKITVPFTMYAKDMRTLTAATLRNITVNGGANYSDTCPIQRKWLEDINRISSTYAKRKVKMISDYRLANNLNDGIKLTEREVAILKDMSDGLSRTEIASSRNISVNTVKMAVNIIYHKLYAANLPEAIRVAVDRKII